MQLFFEFYEQLQDGRFGKNEFIIQPENETAQQKLKQFFVQKNFADSLMQSLILLGPKASGKTHLLHKFAQEFDVEILSLNEINHFNLMNFLTPNIFYIFDNCDQLNEEQILYLINIANEKKSFLLLAIDSAKNFSLPDLNSRLANMPNIKILLPSLDSLRQILIKNLSSKQIFLSDELVDFFCKNTHRTYEAFNNLAKKIEFFCKERGEKLTMSQAKLLAKATASNH